VSIQATEVPLQDLLRAVSRYGIRVRIDPDINPPVTASFSDRDLGAGLKAILKPTNHIFVWETPGDTFDSPPVLTEIQVFHPGKKERMQPLEPHAVFAVARRGETGPYFILGEVLVRVASRAALETLAEAVERAGGTITPAGNLPMIYRIRFPEDYDVFSLAEQLKRFPGVDTAEPHYAYPIVSPARVGKVGPASPVLPDRPQDAPGAPVAILDTGVEMIAGLSDRVKTTLNALDPDAAPSDTQGHGTQMALVAAGLVTPTGKASSDLGSPDVLPIKVFDGNGFTSGLTVFNSVAFALENGARVLSLSWGSETGSEIMESIFRAASGKGLLIVAAAGNEPTGRPFFPAAYDAVIGVGALNPDGTRWVNSNHGEFVSFYAPGFATLPIGYGGDPGGYAGTSIATAYTANLVAGYLDQNPQAGLVEVKDYLRAVLGP